MQAHPPSAAELASIEGQGRGLGLQDAYGAGEAGSSEDEEEAEGEGEGAQDAAAAEPAEQQAAVAAAAAAAAAAGGKTGGRNKRGGGGPGKLHAAHFTAAESERRRGLWEQRIQRPEMQVGGWVRVGGCVGGWVWCMPSAKAWLGLRPSPAAPFSHLPACSPSVHTDHNCIPPLPGCRASLLGGRSCPLLGTARP